MKNKTYILPLVIGCLILFIPLVRDFHFELALIVATIGCFWSGFKAASAHNDEDISRSLNILGLLVLFSVPSAIYASFWGCITLDGFLFWTLFTIPSAFLGAAIGKLVRASSLSHKKTITAAILLFIALGTLIIEFLTLPQVYFFNHVWGAWPGPIYDESVHVGWNLMIFRSITMLWVILLWNVRSFRKGIEYQIKVGFSLIALLLAYTSLDEYDISTPTQKLERTLSRHVETEHFDLFFDPNLYSEEEIQWYSNKHEFYFDEILEQLDMTWPEGRKIKSFLYAHAWQKKELVGAKFTSYVPVWLEEDHLHIAKQQLDGVLKHELVHVMTKPFGNKLFHASWSIGMIEGLAVAIAPDRSDVSTIDQIVAAEDEYPSVDNIKSAFSFAGFYSGASSVSYTTTGSFVKYLYENYSLDLLKESYRTGNLSNYPVSTEVLVQQWHQHLSTIHIDALDQQVSEFIFGQRSLFEKSCPHVVTEPLRLWDNVSYLLEEKDTLQAYQELDKLISVSEANDFIKTEWLRASLMRGLTEQVIASVEESDTLLTHQLLKADAFALNLDFERAFQLKEALRPRIEKTNARQFRYSYDLRKDSLNWGSHVERRFKKELPDVSEYPLLTPANQVLSINRALQLNNDYLLKNYFVLHRPESIHQDWFDVYWLGIERLLRHSEFELASTWISYLQNMPLRARYQERLQELEKLSEYLPSR